MKKLKIRSKEIRRLGFTSENAIHLAANLAKKYYSRDQKVIVLDILRELRAEPEKFIHHQHFSELAELYTSEMIKPKQQKPKKQKIRSVAADFVIYGDKNIDPEAVNQMIRAMKMPITVKGALMADAHVGYGLPIGGVVAAYNAVMPYGVGMDIGCRMCLSIYPGPPEILEKSKDFIKDILIQNTRFGLAEFNDITEHELLERPEWKEIRFLRQLKDRFHNQLGTSGHGNHFVDVGILVIRKYSDQLKLDPGRYLSVLSHSGSRNFGAEVAKHYTDVAREKLGMTGEESKLAWLELDSEEGQEYWKAMTLAGAYSAANHDIIHDKISSALRLKPLQRVENHHNFAWKEQLSEHEQLVVHRKGATPANIGDIGIIPGNMVAPAFIVSGKGNENSINSAAHGAGRLISRRKAKKTFTKSQLESILKNNGVELIGGSTDESPGAYKDIFQVMDAQKDLVNILGMFYPKIVRME